MDIGSLAHIIRQFRAAISPARAMLAGISGIDASGKGFIAARLADALKESGLETALINVDGWLNLPAVRFGGDDPARHFYHNALRLDELFQRLVLPLKSCRSVRITAELAGETDVTFHALDYDFDAVDIILLEGIFLFRKQYRDLFDLKIWIECSFETALDRAVLRSQEGLGPEATIAAYRTIYFPAQRCHFAADSPASFADLIFPNDVYRPAR